MVTLHLSHMGTRLPSDRMVGTLNQQGHIVNSDPHLQLGHMAILHNMDLGILDNMGMGTLDMDTLNNMGKGTLSSMGMGTLSKGTLNSMGMGMDTLNNMDMVTLNKVATLIMVTILMYKAGLTHLFHNYIDQLTTRNHMISDSFFVKSFMANQH